MKIAILSHEILTFLKVQNQFLDNFENMNFCLQNGIPELQNWQKSKIKYLPSLVTTAECLKPALT